MKFMLGETGETLTKSTSTLFRPPRNPHEVSDRDTNLGRQPVGGERLTAFATEPPCKLILKQISILLEG